MKLPPHPTSVTGDQIRAEQRRSHLRSASFVRRVARPFTVLVDVLAFVTTILKVVVGH